MIVPYQFEPPKDGTAHLYLLGDIVEDAYIMGESSPATLAAQIGAANAENLVCHINSYGGLTSAGMAIYNILRGCGAKVTTINEGFCCSAASLIFMAGEKRIMRNSSLLMIHNAWTMGTGNANELRKLADDLEKISNTAANIYRENVSIDNDVLQGLLDAESWITPDEAVSYGFATEVVADEQHEAAYSSAFRTIQHTLLSGGKQNEPELNQFQKFHKNFYKKEK